jgi:hypothetical protein
VAFPQLNHQRPGSHPDLQQRPLHDVHSVVTVRRARGEVPEPGLVSSRGMAASVARGPVGVSGRLFELTAAALHLG